MTDRALVERAIEASWSAYTTYNRHYHPDSEERRRLGQSGPTALAIHDFLGGTLLVESVVLPTGERTKHYSVQLDDEHIDPTRTQYDFYADKGGVVFAGDVQAVARSEFDERHPQSLVYDVLRRNVDLVLGD